jgi:outer membrane protein TolC
MAQSDDGVQQFSLEQCIEYALQNAVPVKNAALNIKAADASVNEVRADGLPQINGEVQIIDNYNLQTTFLPAVFFDENAESSAPPVPVKFGVRFMGNAGITLRQLIFDGTFFLGLKAATTYKEMAKKNLKRTKIETVEAITKAYYGALISEERLKLTAENYKRLDTLFKQTTAMYENGFSEKIDVSRIRVNLNNVKTQLTNLSQMKELSMVLLKFQMGMKVTEELSLKDELQDIEIEEMIATSEVPNYEDRIEFSINETQKVVDQLNIKRFQVGYLPKLYAFTGLGVNAGSNRFGDLINIGEDWFSNGNYGFTLSVPIFDGMRKKYQIEQARIQLLQTENMTMQLASMIDTEYAQAKINLESSMNVLESEAENQELAEEIYKISNIKYTEGVGSSFELVDAETALTNSQTNYYNALYNTLISKVDYLKAMGQLYNE